MIINKVNLRESTIKKQNLKMLEDLAPSVLEIFTGLLEIQKAESKKPKYVYKKLAPV